MENLTTSDHFTSEETVLEKHQLTSRKCMWESKIETYSNGVTMIHMLYANGNQSWVCSGRLRVFVVCLHINF